jgi:hypothetical protein
MLYGVAHEDPTCQFFIPLLVAFRRISRKRSTHISDRKHACVFAVMHGKGVKSNVVCNTIIVLATFSATCVRVLGVGIQKAWVTASILKQKRSSDLLDLDFEFSFSFSLPLAPSPLGQVVEHIKEAP